MNTRMASSTMGRILAASLLYVVIASAAILFGCNKSEDSSSTSGTNDKQTKKDGGTTPAPPAGQTPTGGNERAPAKGTPAAEPAGGNPLTRLVGKLTDGRDSSKKGPEAAGAPGSLHFACTKCGATFTKTMQEIAGGPEGMLMEEAGVVQMDCPKCSGKKCAMIMTKCPKCKKYYLAESTKQMAKQMAAAGDDAPPPPSKPVKDICPHCGTDRLEWYREQYRKKRGR